MSVRSGVMATFLVFVLALIGLGAWSAWHLRELAGVSRRIIADNYDSVVAAQDRKESLERQDSAALFILLGDDERGRSQLRVHRPRFDRAFGRAAGNITEPGERAVIADIDALRTTYYARFDAVLGNPRDAARNEYFAGLEPLFNQLRGRVDDLLRLAKAFSSVRLSTARLNAAKDSARYFNTSSLDLTSPGPRSSAMSLVTRSPRIV